MIFRPHNYLEGGWEAICEERKILNVILWDENNIF